MMRFVVSPQGEITPDLECKLPGRGIWLSANRAAIDTAVSKRLFARAAKQQVSVAPELASRLEQLLRNRALALLGLAHRAGAVTFGFDKVAAAVRARNAALLVQASDTAEGGREKMRTALRAGKNEAVLVELFDREELSLALGRENVVHAALRSGGLATRFLSECNRLTGFCEQPGANGTDGAIADDAQDRGTGVDLTGFTA
jgi:predicted RNA-binding protein YlxR (DUF448 family)